MSFDAVLWSLYAVAVVLMTAASARKAELLHWLRERRLGE